MLTEKQFIDEVFKLRLIYREDNQWVGKWDESWNDDVVMTKFVKAAYALYKGTATNALKLTLLGGTEIRLDKGYVRNFGVTAANGIQDAQTALWVQQAMTWRKFMGHHNSNGRYNAQRPLKTVVPVTGVGSILSEKMWTPILNDALILGAIAGSQTFALALTADEQAGWQRMNGDKANKTAVLAAKFGNSKNLTDAWKNFLNAHPKMFFDDFGPRVFTREMLGLKFFGYKPEFSWHQLGFQKGPGAKGEQPTFTNYANKLRAVHFHYPVDRAGITAELSMFLFNDRTSLTLKGR